MASWQPPIPAGALYSKPARDLGPALPLLAYCYDLVQRDGWFDIVLKDAALDMEEPYQNMKRWWAIIRGGSFFAETIDRGKLGWRVRFKDVWIDRRILSARPTNDFSGATEVPQMIPDNLPSSTNEGPETELDSAQVQIKYKSSTNEGSEMVLEEKCIKEDMSDQESGIPRAKFSREQPPGDHPELMAAYQEALGYPIPNGPKEASAAKKILAAGYTVAQTITAYHDLKAGFWSDKHLSLHKVYEELGALLNAPRSPPHRRNGNGRAPPTPVEWNGWQETDLEKGF